MYSAQPNGADSATINPAALNSSVLYTTSSRRNERGRSSAAHNAPSPVSDGEASLRRRRDRSMKKSEASGQAPASSTTSQSNQQPPQAPQAQGASQPSQPAPAYATNLTTAPPKTTPTKSTLKALPTVRDHTTDQLNSTSDEYLPREIDEFGEKKVMANGQLLGNRQYRCRTFLVPNRGDKLFMLATECARVLGYRDSYLLFNKNRSLYKIIASQAEKDDLVQQEILPFSYRSRQIAIVTARSMFRQFGSRVIENGRRVRDDYWETKARKQGFTEADAAGEKRPGAAKAREATEAQNTALISGAPPEIVYNNHPGPYPGATQPHLVQPGMMGAPPGSAPRMPGLTVGSEFSDTRPRDFSGIIKGGPRQEITGPAYQDQTRSSAGGEINSQAHHAADFNRSVNHQRDMRSEYMQGIWRRPHEQPASSSLSQSVNSNDTANVPTSRPSTSPHTTSAGVPPHQPAVVSSQSPQVMMAAPYSPSVHSQNTMGPSSMRGSSGSIGQGTQGYNYPSNQGMWSQNPQAGHHGYGSYTTQAQQQHASQSTAPHLRQPSSGQLQSSMPFPGMAGMQYGASQNMYGSDQTPRPYLGQSAPSSGQASSQQQWSGQHSPPPPQWWTPPQQPQ